MCGIVGILGHSNVTDRLLEGLSRLEYRGYDSAGVAVLTDAGVAVRRSVGKFNTLRESLAKKPADGIVGIGHTRWATHGAPTMDNSHPHRSGRVTVVHNGIIENHEELRSELEDEGRRFYSETDTEVVAHLCDRFVCRGASPREAVRRTLSNLKGAYALAFLFDDNPEEMIVARRGSPLVIGYGASESDGSMEMFAGSDALALAPFTSRVSYLEDGDMAVLSRSRVVIQDLEGAEVIREIREIATESFCVDKGRYRHFMAKEIHEQPESLARALTGLVDPHTQKLLPILEGVDFSQADRIILVACGTAHYACHVAKYWIESLGGLPVETEIASEYRYRNLALSGREIAVFVSQSGETADTLAAMHHLKGRVAHRIAVINVPTSSIAREADHILDIKAGPEIGVASTKAFTGQLLSLAAIALIDRNVPAIIFAPSGAHFEKTVSNAEEVAARGGRLVWVSDRADLSSMSGQGSCVLKVPEVPEIWSPIVYAVVAQLIAYHVAILKGTDLDQPRNLAKSVTVE